MNITYNEMLDQYEALRKTYDYIMSKEKDLKDYYERCNPKSITFTGCGSGYCLAHSGEMIARLRLGAASQLLAAGDLLLNNKEYKDLVHESMVFLLSRSGSTSEIIKSIQALKKGSDNYYLGVVAKENSELSSYLDFCLEIPWAFDKSVCQTRCVTNLYMAMVLIISIFANDKKLRDDIQKVINYGKEYMSANLGLLREISKNEFDRIFILSDGETQGISSEAAMAFIEISGLPAHYYHILDVRHGPMILINDKTLVISYLNKGNFELQNDLVKDIKSRGAKQLVFTTVKGEYEGADYQIKYEKDVSYVVGGIPFIFISQCLSIFIAEKNGINPDTPIGLDPWVKL